MVSNIIIKMIPKNDKPYCDICDKYFSNKYNLQRHQSTITHKNKSSTTPIKNIEANPIKDNPFAKDIKINSMNGKTIIRNNDTINIFMPINGVNTKIFSHTFKEGDDYTMLNDLKEALKPVKEIAGLMREMVKSDDKVGIQRRIDILNNQLNWNIYQVPFIKKLLFLFNIGVLEKYYRAMNSSL